MEKSICITASSRTFLINDEKCGLGVRRKGAVLDHDVGLVECFPVEDDADRQNCRLFDDQ